MAVATNATLPAPINAQPGKSVSMIPLHGNVCLAHYSAMATKHGNRVYIQVLLEPYRGELFLLEAEKQNLKPSALLRQLAYEYVAENVDEEAYCDAIVKDKQKWQEAVDARLLGRAQSRAAVIESSNEAI